MPNSLFPQGTDPDFYYLSFPDGSLSKKLLNFGAHTTQDLWTHEELNKQIAQKIYQLEEHISPHYYPRTIVTPSAYRRYVISDVGKDKTRIIQQELQLCFVKLQTWAKLQRLQVYDEHHQLRDIEGLLVHFFERLIRNEFIEKTALFYGEGKKFIENITLLIHDDSITLSFRQNQLINLAIDGNLNYCAEGCFSRFSKVAESLKNYVEVNLSSLINQFITVLSREIANNNPYEGSYSFVEILCNEEQLSLIEHEIHAENYLINRLLSELGAFSLKSKDDYTKLFNKNSIEIIYQEFTAQFRKKFRATNIVRFIKEQYYQKNNINFINGIFSSSEPLDIPALEDFLQKIGNDKDFSLNEILDINSNNEIILNNNALLSITISERLLNQGYFNLLPDSRWLDKYHTLSSFFQQKQISYSPLTNEENEDNYRIFTGNLELSWIKKEGSREPLLAVLIKEDKPVTLLQNKIPKEKLNALLENIDDLNLFFSSLSKKEHLLALDWLSKGSFDLRATLLSQLLLVNQEPSDSKTFYEDYTLLINVNKLFAVLDNNARSNLLKRFSANELISKLLSDCIIVYRIQSPLMIQAFVNFIRNIIIGGFQNFKDLTFETPLLINNKLYLKNIDFIENNFENVHIKTITHKLNFRNVRFKEVIFYNEINHLNIEESTGDIQFFDHVLNSQLSNFYGNLIFHAFVKQVEIKNFAGTLIFNHNVENLELHHSDVELIVNGDINHCNFYNLKPRKITIDGKITNSYFTFTDFTHTRFKATINEKLSLNSKFNIFSGKNLLIQENPYQSFFLGSKFSTESLIDFLEYPWLHTKAECYFLRSTVLREVNFQDPYLQTTLKKFKLIDFSGADLEKVNLDNFMKDALPDLYQFRLSHANLKGASFYQSFLDKTDLTGADLSHCDLSTIQFRAIRVTHAKMVNARLSVRLLFYFYNQSHRNFSTIRLTGTLADYQGLSLEGAQLSIQAFNHLAKQGYRNFYKTNLESVPHELIIYWQHRKNLILDEAILPKNFGRRQCLETSFKRRKREEICQFDWQDIEKFNEEKIDTRNIEKIRINSKKFIDVLKASSIEKRKQLIEFANNHWIQDSEKMKIEQLTQLSCWEIYLNKASQVSSLINAEMITQDMIVAIFRGDYADTAINLGFLTGTPLLAKFVQQMRLQGAILATSGKVMLGNLIQLSSPFVEHGSSVYIVYDWLQSLDALNLEDFNTLLRVADDSIFLSNDAIQIGVKTAHFFGIFEDISSITGPIGSIVGTIVFLGSRIFQTRQRIAKINSLIPLTASEYFYEELRVFIGMQVKAEIMELLEEKEINNQLVTHAFAYLNKHTSIKNYIFPNFKKILECHCLPFYNEDSANFKTKDCEHECKQKFVKNSDNWIDLNLLDETHSIQWDRTKPKMPQSGKLLCFTSAKKTEEIVESADPNFLCENAIGITDLSPKTENYTLIDSGEGTIIIRGFLQSENIIVSHQAKNITLIGGNRNDIFILEGDMTTGSIYGLKGSNTLELKNFAPERHSLIIHLPDQVLAFDNDDLHNETRNIWIQQLQHILGRSKKKETIVCACDTQFIETRGALKNASDRIIIPANQACYYRMHIKIASYSNIANHATRGNFSYIITRTQGESTIFLEQATTENQVFFNYTLAELNGIYLSNQNKYAYFKQATFYFLAPEINQAIAEKGYNVTFDTINNVSILYHLKDQTEINIGQHQTYICQKTHKSPNVIIQEYLEIATRLKATLIITANNESVVIANPGHHTILQNNLFMPSHLFGNNQQNIYQIKPKKQPGFLPKVTLYQLHPNEKNIETLDLQALINDFEKRSKCPAYLVANRIDHDLQLLVKPSNDCQSITPKILVEVILKDAILKSWYHYLHVRTHQSLLEIICQQNKNSTFWTLKPKPIVFGQNKLIIVLSAQDIEPYTLIYVRHLFQSYLMARTGKNLTDLVLTTKPVNSAFLAIILKNFFDISKLARNKLCTLSIEFDNKVIKLERFANLSIESVPTLDHLRDHERNKSYQYLQEVNLRKQRAIEKEHSFNAQRLLTFSSSATKPRLYFPLFLLKNFRILTQFVGHIEKKQPSSTHLIDCKLSFFNHTVIKDNPIRVYHAKCHFITITIPLSALLYGSISGSLEKLGQRYQSSFPYLPGIIDHGINSFLRYASYIELNNLIASPIYFLTHYFNSCLIHISEKTIADKIQNKIVRLGFTLICYAFWCDLGIFNDEDRLKLFTSLLFGSLMRFFLFKGGEWSTKKMITKFFNQPAAPHADNDEKISSSSLSTFNFKI